MKHSDVLDFLTHTRRLAYVPRWVIVRRIKEQNVAEHQYFTAIYCMLLAKLLKLPERIGCEAALLSLLHDIGEIVSGDIPGPAKPILSVDCSAATKHALFITSMNKILNEDREIDPDQALIHRLLKVADELDGCVWLAEEVALGSKWSAAHLDQSRGRLRDKLGALEEGSDVWIMLSSVLNQIERGSASILRDTR